MEDKDSIERIFVSFIGSLTRDEAERTAQRLKGRDVNRVEKKWVEACAGRRLAHAVFHPVLWAQRAGEIAGYCSRQGIRICTTEHPGYPRMLREIYDPPYLLYYRSRRSLLPDAQAVAVVGTRRASRQSLSAAYRLGAEAAAAGIVLVSGLARGVDSAAHQGCVDAGGITWAVLGSGVDCIYPRSGAGLSRRILESGGALISEFPPLEGPRRWHFPKRNRIVSGLCSCVVVVEAPERSGALITADFALQEGRDVYVLPSSSDGNRMLSMQGAEEIESLHQIPGLTGTYR
jgi:DNA processing protein